MLGCSCMVVMVILLSILLFGFFLMFVCIVFMVV